VIDRLGTKTVNYVLQISSSKHVNYIFFLFIAWNTWFTTTTFMSRDTVNLFDLNLNLNPCQNIASICVTLIFVKTTFQKIWKLCKPCNLTRVNFLKSICVPFLPRVSTEINFVGIPIGINFYFWRNYWSKL
jgi:hypothetical protein